MTTRHLVNKHLIEQMHKKDELEYTYGTRYKVRHDTTLWTINGPVNLKRGQTFFIAKTLSEVVVLGE